MSLLFTPGPLTTSKSVKEASLYDLGSRDAKFINLVKNIRSKLLTLAKVNDDRYSAILMPGSGTMGVESVLNSTVGPFGKVLIVINGAYGERMKIMCKKANIRYQILEYTWDTPFNPDEIIKELEINPYISAVAVVHSETTTGLMNPIKELGSILKNDYPNVSYIVDAMSSFGGIPIDMKQFGISYLISSSNKCIQGIPGFSYVLASLNHLINGEKWARTASLDLHDQYELMNKTNEFRYTPPVQSILAFNQALKELDAEGGIEARYKRYKANQKILSDGLEEIGFKLYLKKEVQSPIITTFKEPLNFNFNNFYQNLSQEGYIIYGGKLKQVNTFRVGNIGNLHSHDIHGFNKTVKNVLSKMKYVIRY